MFPDVIISSRIQLIGTSKWQKPRPEPAKRKNIVIDIELTPQITKIIVRV